MPVMAGLDVALRDGWARFAGASLGVLCNQSSISREFAHLLDLLVEPHRSRRLQVAAVFGPEHGLHGHTQDNMIEWEGSADPRTGFVVHSLYGQYREPQDFMLEGVDRFVVDIPDVGARYYTFIWTMAHCMAACARLGIPLTVLDRPNPIGGTQVEGTVLDPAYASFVGLHPLPTRHGLTPGEVAVHLRQTLYPRLQLDVVRLEGWERSRYYDEHDLPWAMPSPNMPTVDTAVVYPGGCLLEATMLSEGRGTTRPFEIFGAPYIDGWKLCAALNGLGLPGCAFRPIEFEPTFNKHARTLCGGGFLHVTDRQAFEPVLAFVAIMQETVRLYGDAFQWKPGPYEYEHEKRPIDILAGNAWLAEAIENLEPLGRIRERFQGECEAFEPARKSALLYS